MRQCTHACRTFLRAIAARIQTLATLNAYADQCTPQVLATWLILLARCQHRDVAVATSICDRLTRSPDKQFKSISDLSGMIWAYAVLLLPDPMPLLDHCMLSAPDILHAYHKEKKHTDVKNMSIHLGSSREKSRRLPNQVGFIFST
jgi:hypothetical protein